MTVCGAQDPYLSISILRIASTLIWVFKNFFNQDLREQRRDLFKLRNFDHSEDSAAANFQWIQGRLWNGNVFLSISCFAHTVAVPLSVYSKPWPCQNMKKLWYIENSLVALKRAQYVHFKHLQARTIYFPLWGDFPGHLLCSWSRHSNVSSVSISRVARLSETITDSLNYFPFLILHFL